MSDYEFDFVVVGAGAAGATLARALVADGRTTVALLEAGPSDERPEIIDLFRFREMLSGPLTRHLPTVATHGNNPRVSYPQSFVQGGCASHNSGLWFRPPDSDFAEWGGLGATGWGPAGTAQHFEQLERDVAIEELHLEGAVPRALSEAARASGFAQTAFTHPFDEGYGRYRMNKRGSSRQSASIVYLHPATQRPKNLSLLLETPVLGLEIGAGRRVIGARTPRGLFRARREVVLAAGAFETPRLLMLAGIGPAGHLRSLGIPLVHDLPGVGEHLLDHPAATVTWRAARPLGELGRWRYPGIVFSRILPDAVWPDIEMQLGAEAYSGQEGTRIDDGFCCYMTVNRARSQGRVRLASAGLEDAPLIEPRFFSDPAGYDLSVMIGAVRLARRIFNGAPLDGLRGEEIEPGLSAQTDAEIERSIRREVTTGYHPAGTCRMGARDDIGSVVGPDLVVKCVDGLRVADASVFPAMVSVNINATCMMVGLKAAELMR